LNKRITDKDRIAAIREVAPDRLDELQELDRRHAQLCRAQPFLAGPDLAVKIRGILGQSEFGGN
jgi:hypothetical protein